MTGMYRRRGMNGNPVQSFGFHLFEVFEVFVVGYFCVTFSLPPVDTTVCASGVSNYNLPLRRRKAKISQMA